MKKIFLFVTFIFSISTYGQLNSNYEKGFKAGYCQAKKEDKGQYTTCATSPRAPRPKTGKESYNDGIIAGYKYYGGKGSSQNALINGAKTLGNSKKFVDYGKIVEKSFSSNSNSNNKEKRVGVTSKSKVNQSRHKRSFKIIQKFINKSLKTLHKYGYLNNDCNTYTDSNCHWVLKEEYKNNRKKYYFQEALSNWQGGVVMYNNHLRAIQNQ